MTPTGDQIVPEFDGEDHINVYSQGKTELGKMLSNFYEVGNLPTVYGDFKSVEGFYYYALLLSAGVNKKLYQPLHRLSGFDAKSYGKTALKRFKSKMIRSPNYDRVQELTRSVITLKIGHNKEIRDLFVESHLPLTHYFTYNGSVYEPTDYIGLVPHLERLRKLLKESL